MRILVTALIALMISAAVGAQDQGENISPDVIEGISLFREGKVDEAIAKLEAVLSASPNDAEAHNALGIIYSSRNQYDVAMEHFDKSIAARERNFKAIFNKLNLLITMQRIDDAEALLVQTAEKYPNYANAWVNLGALQMQLGKLDDALASIEKAIALDDNDFDAHFKRGQLLMLKRDYEGARQSFRKTLELNENFAQARRGLTLVEDIIDKLANGYIRVRQIIVPNSALAQEIKKKLDQGEEDFIDLARQYSIGPAAKAGGNLGFIKRGEMVKPLEDAVFVLEVGQVSEIIRSPLGYHIFKREE